MRVAIIGAGFGGLSAGYELVKRGIDVDIYENENEVGGLAIGFTEKDWEWSLEKHYHHWFVSDWDVRNLAKEINHKVIFKHPITSTYIGGKSYQLDSPLSLLQFEKLPFIDRVRTGMVLAYLKITPFWKNLENVTSKDFLIRLGGNKSWDILWKPLFEKKFSKFADKVPASWFWARIKKRSSSLGYPEGGFLAFATDLASNIKSMGGKIYLNTQVVKVQKSKDGIELTYDENSKTIRKVYDKVICTLPFTLFTKITKGLPENYLDSINKSDNVGAVNLVLSLRNKLLNDIYWLNVNETEFPFLAVVEHTNFMDKSHYDNKSIVYIGNYLPHDHDYFSKDENQLLEIFTPYIKKINPNFSSEWVDKAFLFKSFFAQPIFPLGYSKKIAGFETPIDGLYISNMQQVYPWDRGTNYAVKLGREVAKLI